MNDLSHGVKSEYLNKFSMFPGASSDHVSLD